MDRRLTKRGAGGLAAACVLATLAHADLQVLFDEGAPRDQSTASAVFTEAAEAGLTLDPC